MEQLKHDDTERYEALRGFMDGLGDAVGPSDRPNAHRWRRDCQEVSFSQCSWHHRGRARCLAP
jgi:hypothetical protein